MEKPLVNERLLQAWVALLVWVAIEECSRVCREARQLNRPRTLTAQQGYEVCALNLIELLNTVSRRPRQLAGSYG